MATLVERTSRFLILVGLSGRDALTVGDAVIAATDGLPAAIRRSLTWDCGSEMARHASITATGLPVYFAHPHSPWERGSNENLNRIVREFFPKGTDITSDPDYLAMVACDVVATAPPPRDGAGGDRRQRAARVPAHPQALHARLHLPQRRSGAARAGSRPPDPKGSFGLGQHHAHDGASFRKFAPTARNYTAGPGQHELTFSLTRTHSSRSRTTRRR